MNDRKHTATSGRPIGDLPIGRINSFAHAWSGVGGREGLLKAMTKNPETGHRALLEAYFPDEVAKAKALAASDPRPEYCISLKEQLETLALRNDELRFGFTEKEIWNAARELDRLQLSWPDKEGEILTLAGYQDTLFGSWRMHEKAIRATYLNQSICVGFSKRHVNMGKPHGIQPTLQLLEGITHPAKPCIRVERIDLLAHWDRRGGLAPDKVRDQTSAHIGLLATAWQHPTLTRLQDATSWPHWNVAGVLVNMPGYDLRSFCPYVYWAGIDLRVNAHVADGASHGCSSPVLRECWDLT